MTRLRALLLTLAASGAALAAGDPQASPPGPAPTPAPPPQASPSPSPAAPAAGRDIEDFVPSEKVSADDAVAFPTDI